MQIKPGKNPLLVVRMRSADDGIGSRDGRLWTALPYTAIQGLHLWVVASQFHNNKYNSSITCKKENRKREEGKGNSAVSGI